MDIYVYNSAFESVALIDEYESFIWTDRFYKCGDFELCLKASKEMLAILYNGYYIWTPSEVEYINNNARRKMMIIESHEIKSDPENGDRLVVTGRSLESMLDRRIVWQQTEIGYKDKVQYPDNDDFQEAIKRLLNENLISPSDSNRQISNFVFDSTTDNYICGLTLKGQFLGDSLYDVISTNCEDNEIGFKITIDDSNVFHFSLYRGLDHSYAQESNYATIAVSEITPVDDAINGISVIDPIKAYNAGIKSTDYYYLAIYYIDTPYRYWLKTGKTSSGTNLYTSGTFSTVDAMKADMADKIGLTYSSITAEVYETISSYFKATVTKIWNEYVCFSTDLDNTVGSNYKTDSSSYKNISLVGGEGEGTDRTFTTYFNLTTEPTGLLRREIFTDAASTSTSTYADDGETEIILTDAQYESSLKEKGAEELTNSAITNEFEIEVDTNSNYENVNIGDYVDIENEYGVRGRALITEFIHSIDSNGISFYPSLVMTEKYTIGISDFTIVSGGSITNFKIKDSELLYKKIDGLIGQYNIYFEYSYLSYNYYAYKLTRPNGSGETIIYDSEHHTSLANMINSIELMLGFTLSSFSVDSRISPVKATFNLVAI